jgi:hypothetical protein
MTCVASHRSVAARSLVLPTVLVLATTGCFSTWAGFQASGHPGAPDEHVREETVPQPGVSEHLAVSLVDGRFKCTSTQRATDIVYHSAYRYGSGWKRGAAAMFVTEAALAAALYFSRPDDDPSKRATYLVGAGFLAVDAVGTGIIALIPRKEIYRERSVAVTTPVRDACPDGLSMQLAGETYPIDAAGAIGELGDAALTEFLARPTGELIIDFEGRTSPLRSDGLVRAAVFDVPAGTLAVIASP